MLISLKKFAGPTAPLALAHSVSLSTIQTIDPPLLKAGSAPDPPTPTSTEDLQRSIDIWSIFLTIYFNFFFLQIFYETNLLIPTYI